MESLNKEIKNFIQVCFTEIFSLKIYLEKNSNIIAWNSTIKNIEKRKNMDCPYKRNNLKKVLAKTF